MQASKQITRILIVGGDQDQAMKIVATLGNLGTRYMVEVVESGTEALELISSQTYRLVISDFRLPGMNGLDLAQSIRELAPETQVVLMGNDDVEGLDERADDLLLGGVVEKPISDDQVRAIVRHAIGQTGRLDPSRLDDGGSIDGVPSILERLLAKSGAWCVFLLSSSGYPVEMAGATADLDIPGLGALIAANFSASAELARMLGSRSVFKSSFLEGPDYNIHAYDINGGFFLAVIFGAQVKPGAVLFFAKQAAAKIAPLLADRTSGDGLENDLEAQLEAGFDELLASSDEEALKSFDEAVKAGLISPDPGPGAPDDPAE